MDRVDLRAQALEAWAVAWVQQQEALPASKGSLLTVSGDASFRRYFRLPLQEGALIAVDAPPEKENSRPFVAIARALLAHGVDVPQVLAVDFEQGFMLLSDFGDTLLLGQLKPATVDALYAKALDELVHMQDCESVPGYTLPPYDHRRLLDEMLLLRDWFCERYLGLELSAEQQAVLSTSFELIAQDCLAQPQVFVHRDYHSRNLMLLADQGQGVGIGVIDFQDAVSGPITYDLVSLLRDAYIAWPEADVRRWVRQFAASLRQQGKLGGVSDATFMRWFDWMGAQRHLKVVGIFARLSLRDGKHGYLNDIPLVFKYLLAEIRHYPELAPLESLLREVVLPAYLKKQPEAAALLSGN